MDGQLHHLIKVVDLSNRALQNMQLDKYQEDEYIYSVLFEIMMENSLKSKMLNKPDIKIVAKSLPEWYDYLKSRNCKRVYVRLEINSDDRLLSAFANGVSGRVMICVYDDFFEIWRNVFLVHGQGWNVRYQRLQKCNGVFNFDHVDCNHAIDHLIECYQRIGDFALVINFEYWANFFYTGKEKLEAMKKNGEFDAEQLLANIQWPFGGMGWWNDSPPYYAHDLGKEDEYDIVTDNLFKAIHVALEATVNKP